MENIDPRVKRTKKMFKDALKELMMVHEDLYGYHSERIMRKSWIK